MALLGLSADLENNGNNHRKAQETTAHYHDQWAYNIKMENRVYSQTESNFIGKVPQGKSTTSA